MKKTFDIKLTQTDIQKVIKYCEDMSKRFSRKTDEICKRIAEEGADIARIAYGSPVNVTVERNEDGNGYKIVASGRAVAFLEFGAGYGVDPTNGLAKEATAKGLPVYEGSWSEQDKQQFVRWKFWIFGGQIMNTVPARNALWEADKVMCAEAARIAMEVINKR